MTIRAILAAGVLLSGLGAGHPALAQKPGGTLKIYHRDSPASMSILEEATLSTSMPMMGVFNNLLLYDLHVPQNSLQAIVPELATGWSWSEDGKELSFRFAKASSGTTADRSPPMTSSARGTS
jgi:peptide/nickel transport system substrate-binding protein